MMALRFKMPEVPLHIKLSYKGTDVDNGTMPVEDVILALKGFAGAYGKVADELLPESSHQLRVSAIEKSSFSLSVLAWITLPQAGDAIEKIRSVGSAAKYVFSVLSRLVEVKKHVKSRPYEIKVEGSHNTILIVNNDGGTMEFPREALPILQDKTVDSDLEKIASPLNGDVVSSAELIAADDQGILETSIASQDKDFFSVLEEEETKNDVEVSGVIVSASKESHRGIFMRLDGHKVPYKFVGSDQQSFYSSFAHRGVVRVFATAFFDQNLTLKRIDISRVVRLQAELNLTPPDEVLPSPE
jgi:hypothetical protein